MANVLKREKREQIEALGRLGWSLRRIEQEVGIRRETASRYLKRAGIAVRDPRQRRRPASKAASEVTSESSAVDSKAASEATTDLERPQTPRTSSACSGYEPWIRDQLDLGRNAKAIWQDLVTAHGFDHGYESVKRFVRKLRGASAKRDAHPRIETAPGEEGQVDYGTGPLVRDPDTGKYRRTRLFAFTLGWSRKSVWLLAWKSSVEIWCRLHEEAFARLGGAPKVTVLDNLREGVIRPDIYDPELNQLYASMLRHYGSAALPARVRHPDRKGKVESAVAHAQGTALKGLRFECLKDAQARLDDWSSRWADTRIHGTTKEEVRLRFDKERPYLLNLPDEPFRYWKEGRRRVALDGCVEVEAAYYSTPPGCIGEELLVQWDERQVRLVDPTTGELLREHWKTHRGGRRQDPADRSKKTPPTTLALLSRANGAGKAVGELCAAMHKRDGEAAVRRIQGLIALVRKHGPTTVDRVCSDALSIGCADYRAVKKLIGKRAQPPVSLKQTDQMIRQLTIYRDFVSTIANHS